MSNATTPEQDKAPNVRSPGLANLIKIVRNSDYISVFIDGEELPWPLAREPITTTVNSEGIATVQLTLFADRVELTDIPD